MQIVGKNMSETEYNHAFEPMSYQLIEDSMSGHVLNPIYTGDPNVQMYEYNPNGSFKYGLIDNKKDDVIGQIDPAVFGGYFIKPSTETKYVYEQTVINLIAAPSCGKTTIAAGLFHKMKTHEARVAIAHEWIQKLIYEQPKSNVDKYPQAYIFAMQQHEQDVLLDYGFKYVICESPLILSLLYQKYEDYNTASAFNMFVTSEFNKYNNKNFLITRTESFLYSEFGRQQSLNEAKELDSKLMSILRDAKIPFTTISGKNGVNEIWEAMKFNTEFPENK